jgi:hypothetical protein
MGQNVGFSLAVECATKNIGAFTRGYKFLGSYRPIISSSTSNLRAVMIGVDVHNNSFTKISYDRI